MTFLGFIQFFMINFYAYTVIGFLINIFATGTDAVCVTLTLELVTTSRRTAFGIGMGYVWVIVLASLSLLAYLINSWRYLCLSVFIILSVITFLSFWLVQESFIWLISVNKIDKALEVIKWIAKFNCLTNLEKFQNKKQELDKSLNRLKIFNEKNLKNTNKTEITVKQMFLEIIRYPKFRLYTLVMTLNYFVTALIYDGLQYLNAQVGDNIFIDWMALSFAEMPGQILCHIFLSRFGRRLSTSIYLIICGVTLIATSILFTCKL
jgi:MFS family permease